MNSAIARNPVLLVHGIFRQSAVFRNMTVYLTQMGWSVSALDMTNYAGFVGIDVLAEQVAAYVDKKFGPEQPLDLVGLSMGGLVSRYYLQRLGGIDRVQRFVSVASPHHGTWMAYLIARPGCFQMRPGSDFLADLNREEEMIEAVAVTSIWTAWDFIIVPGSSARLTVGNVVKLPVFAHACMASHPKSLEAVATALSAPVKRDRLLAQIRDRQKLPDNGSNT